MIHIKHQALIQAVMQSTKPYWHAGAPTYEIDIDQKDG